MTYWLDARAADFASGFNAFLSVKREVDEDVAASVRAIVAEVRARGDAALIDFGARFDKVSLTPATLRLSFATADPQKIELGIAKLGRAI